MAVTFPFGSGFSAQNKTAGTTLAMLGSTLTLLVDDDVFIGFVGDNTVTPTVAATGGTATFAAATVENSTLEGTSAGMATLWRMTCTGAGTLTGITVTHASITARAGAAFVFRGVPAVQKDNCGIQGAATQVQGPKIGSSINGTSVLTGDFWVAFRGWEGVAVDSGGLVTSSFADAGTSEGIIATSGGGTASNQAGDFVFQLAATADSVTSGGFSYDLLTASRNNVGVAAWYAAVAVPGDLASSPRRMPLGV